MSEKTARSKASTAPDITMTICTRNRAEQLRRVLETAVRFRIPDGLRWEFLVIDNGSTDHTAEVVRSFEDRLPVRCVREARAGLSHARNRAVAEAAGRYICWTDDDVLVDAEWLASYWAAFQRHPDAAIFAGRITPVLEAPVAAWFSDLRAAWPVNIILAERDFGAAPRPLDFPAGVIPFGANFAIRTVEQRQVLYEPGLGVSPHHRRVGEEAEVIFRLMSAGATGWWTPDARVDHMIAVHRQTWDYIYDYAASYGETLAYLQQTWPGAHHLATSRDAGRIGGSATQLQFRMTLYLATSWIARLLGARRRGAAHLATAGMFAGAGRFLRGMSAGQPG